MHRPYSVYLGLAVKSHWLWIDDHASSWVVDHAWSYVGNAARYQSDGSKQNIVQTLFTGRGPFA